MAGEAETSTPQAAEARRRGLGAVPIIGVVIAVLLAGQLLGPSGAPDIVELPAVGHLLPSQLADGTPVWVRHDIPGEATVLEAFAPETDVVGTPGRGIVELAAWCPRGDRFVAPHFGASYSPDGRRYQVRDPGRLPREASRRGDLTLRETIEIGGARLAGDPVRVGEAAGREPIDGAVTPARYGDQRFGTPGECTLATGRLVETTPPPAAGAEAEPLDHSRLAQPLPAASQDGWIITTGAMVIDDDGTATWCADAPATDPPVCAAPTDVVVDLGFSPADTAGSWAMLSGPMGLRFADGRIVQVGLMFATTWRGSSLQGGFSYEARFVELDFTSSAILLRPPPRGVEDCLGPAPRPNGLGARQFVGLDTRFRIGGITDPLVLSTDDRASGTDVAITVDAATCRALLVVG